MVKNPSRWRINQLCILGAIIGLIALFLPWTWMQMGGGSSSASIAYYMMRPPGAIGLVNAFDVLFDVISFPFLVSSYGPLFMSMLLLYIIGTIIAFISPIGGFIQIAGALLCLPAMHSESWFNWFVPFGELLGAFSGIIVVASIFKPMGEGYVKIASDIRGRLVAFRRSHIESPAPSETGRGERTFRGSVSSLLRRISIPKKMLLPLLIPVILVLAVFSYYVIAVPQPYYGGGDGPISAIKSTTVATWTFTIQSTGGSGQILKSDVYVQVKNQLGNIKVTTTVLLTASGTQGFNYSAASSGEFLSVGDAFSLDRSMYAVGSSITLLTPYSMGTYAVLTV